MVTKKVKQLTSTSLATLFEDLDADLDGDVGSALCGHALIELAKALRKRNKSIFQTEDDFEAVYERIIG